MFGFCQATDRELLFGFSQARPPNLTCSFTWRTPDETSVYFVVYFVVLGKSALTLS